MNPLMWSPSKTRILQSHMKSFFEHINTKYGHSFSHYTELHRWSIQNRDLFWKELFSFFPIRYQGDLDHIGEISHFNTSNWFPQVYLNFAGNLLATTSTEENNLTAVCFIHESGLKREISYGELSNLVGQLQCSLREFIQKGDVLAAYMPNIPETVTAMLATNALGGIFTSTSCDFGATGVLDRFQQSKPKVLVATPGYQYNGKYFDKMEIIKILQAKIPSLKKIIIVDFLGQRPSLKSITKAVFWEDFLDGRPQSPHFLPLPFSHPLCIVYSSGTTGRPKCIVHSQGGMLLQHVKELGHHTDLKSKKKIFYFTTCGWMMWNWLISSLFFKSEVFLYEGSPSYPDMSSLFALIEREEINIFGTSPKYLSSVEKNLGPIKSNLSSLETLLSTGAPLLPEQYDYVYGHIKQDIHLASISGGTDIMGCFALGNPMKNVYRGEIQCIGLGMDLDCFDQNGHSIKNDKGELVCKRPFPSTPLFFLNDPEKKLYGHAYFDRNPTIWYHGDQIKITPQGGVIVYGRSDATLNPGGVRIGTAEIYGQIEVFSYIDDVLCAAKRTQGDEQIYLFVKMQDGEKLTPQRIQEIKERIRKNTTPRHVPKLIASIKDIPYTYSGKKVELAVTNIINGGYVRETQSISNPECLENYKTFRS